MQIMAKKVVLQFFVLQAMHHIRKHDEYQRYFLTTDMMIQCTLYIFLNG